MKRVEDSWGPATIIQDMNQLQSTLGRVQTSLQEWERTVFGSARLGKAETGAGD